jgi:hypothetical protein
MPADDEKTPHYLFSSRRTPSSRASLTAADSVCRKLQLEEWTRKTWKVSSSKVGLSPDLENRMERNGEIGLLASPERVKAYAARTAWPNPDSGLTRRATPESRLACLVCHTPRGVQLVKRGNSFRAYKTNARSAIHCALGSLGLPSFPQGSHNLLRIPRHQIFDSRFG